MKYLNRYERKFIGRQRIFNILRTHPRFQYSKVFTLARYSRIGFLNRILNKRHFGPENYLFYFSHSRLYIFVYYYFVYTFLGQIASRRSFSKSAGCTKKSRRLHSKVQVCKRAEYHSRKSRKQANDKEFLEEFL